jgi:hypothetical protein
VEEISGLSAVRIFALTLLALIGPISRRRAFSTRLAVLDRGGACLLVKTAAGSSQTVAQEPTLNLRAPPAVINFLEMVIDDPLAIGRPATYSLSLPHYVPESGQSTFRSPHRPRPVLIVPVVTYWRCRCECGVIKRRSRRCSAGRQRYTGRQDQNNGRVYLNNLAENSVRPVALGRRNWIHIGSSRAGPKIAAILSVVESCHRLKLPVRDYLAAVLRGLADLPIRRLPGFTPAAWVAQRS